jgi:hypothetical protein
MAEIPDVPVPSYARNMRLIGYSDQGGRSDGQQIMVHSGYAYIGHVCSQGFSIVDVHDPRKPRAVGYVPNPPNTWSLHLQVHQDLLLLVHARDMFSMPEMADERNHYKGKADFHALAKPPAARDRSAGMAVYDISKPVRSRIHQLPRRRRHAGADLWGRVADVVHPNSSVLVGGENQSGALKAAGPILVHIVRPEMAADRDVIAIDRHRQGGDTDGSALHLVVEHPDRLVTIGSPVEHRLFEDDQQVAIGQRQGVVGAAGDRRKPALMGNQLGRAAVGDVDHHEAGVALAAIGGVAVDDRMMQAIRPCSRQIGFLPIAGRGLHRIWYVGGRWAYASALFDGFTDYILANLGGSPSEPYPVGNKILPEYLYELHGRICDLASYFPAQKSVLGQRPTTECNARSGRGTGRRRED